jgi:hypothetical protein
MITAYIILGIISSIIAILLIIREGESIDCKKLFLYFAQVYLSFVLGPVVITGIVIIGFIYLLFKIFNSKTWKRN